MSRKIALKTISIAYYHVACVIQHRLGEKPVGTYEGNLLNGDDFLKTEKRGEVDLDKWHHNQNYLEVRTLQEML